MKKREQPLVRPPKSAKMVYRQSRFPHLCPTPFRMLAAGRTGSGKSSALYSAVVDHYRGCFNKGLVLIARTVNLDHTYVQLQEWATKHYKQDNREKQFVFTSFDDEDALMTIFREHEDLVAKEKIQRKTDNSSEPLSSLLWVVDDLSDSTALRSRNESVLNKIATTGRHSGQSLFLCIHALSAAGTLLRKSASCLLVFIISNRKEFEAIANEYAHLVGGMEAFTEIYNAAVGKGAPPYSFLTIMPHESDPDKMFLARFDERLTIEDDD
jgi:hypothetical protein